MKALEKRLLSIAKGISIEGGVVEARLFIDTKEKTIKINRVRPVVLETRPIDEPEEIDTSPTYVG